jgi:hypothetical protein
MGIVSEDTEIVRFLLRNGAIVDVRCTGNFFTSDDQKSSRTDDVNSEHALLSRQTYYTGKKISENLMYIKLIHNFYRSTILGRISAGFCCMSFAK